MEPESSDGSSKKQVPIERGTDGKTGTEGNSACRFLTKEGNELKERNDPIPLPVAHFFKPKASCIIVRSGAPLRNIFFKEDDSAVM